MDTLCPDESVSANKWKRVIIKKLVQGQEAATQLKLLLQKPFGADEGSLSAEELLASVQTSFIESLSVFTSNSPAQNGSPAEAASGNDYSGVGRKRSSSPTKNGGRGCYKRRRTAQSWTRVSPTADDDHAWRKYGQKGILNSKFPRSYFRCTRKHDQGCRATKQVQRTHEHPEMYLTTYIGIHTCKAIPKPPPLVMDSNTPFHVNSLPDSNEQDHPIFSSPTATIKQENFEGKSGDVNVTDHKLDPSIWSDLKEFETSKPSIMPLKMASDHNADTVYSSCSGSHNLDMDFGVDSVHFGTHDDFHFDDSHELL